MWTLIKQCEKQLTIHSRVREKVDDSFLIYEIIQVEPDQYKLELLQRGDQNVSQKIHNVLNCEQLTLYHFEVEEKERA